MTTNAELNAKVIDAEPTHTEQLVERLGVIWHLLGFDGQNFATNTIGEAQALLTAQAVELAQLREVLAWFADEENWYGLPDFESGWFCSASVEGRGRARAALEPAVSTGTGGQS